MSRDDCPVEARPPCARPSYSGRLKGSQILEAHALGLAGAAKYSKGKAHRNGNQWPAWRRDFNGMVLVIGPLFFYINIYREKNVLRTLLTLDVTGPWRTGNRYSFGNGGLESRFSFAHKANSDSRISYSHQSSRVHVMSPRFLFFICSTTARTRKLLVGLGQLLKIYYFISLNFFFVKYMNISFINRRLR